MANYSGASGSPASGPSHLPSPDTFSDAPSRNASPLSAPPSLYASRTSDEPDSPEGSRSISDTTQAATDAMRSHSSAGKGGCWTCRLRRKKCDEEQELEGGPCRTCRRLELECLGWGARRPDWMRDKEKVAAYKASIKEQLTRAGRIRGQPRAAFMQSTSLPAVAGPGPSSSSSTHRYSPLGESRVQRSSYTATRHRQQPGSMGTMQGPASARTSPTSFQYTSTPGAAYPMHDQFQGWSPSYPSHALSPTIPIPSNDESLPYNFLPASVSEPNLQTAPMPPVAHEISDESYVMYYFESVRKEQFVLASNSLANTLYSIVQLDPRGPVANAICALSSLHYIRARIAQGLEPAETIPDDTITKQYYERARWLLGSTKSQHGRYSDTDAIAAILLVEYSIFTGGRKNWQWELEVACEWLGATRIHEEQNPKLTFLNMSPIGKAAAKCTMWVDVLASVTLGQPPRYLSLYKRLFGSGGNGFWANTPQTDVRMDLLTGCPDEALLAIAEISALAHWKSTELRNGSLSVRELIHQGDKIETSLRQPRAAPRQTGEGSLTPLDANLAQATVDLQLPMAGGTVTANSSPTTAMGSHAVASSRMDVLPAIGELYREAAALYLHTVLSENLPGVPEISGAVGKVVTLLNQLPPSEYDRAILFPLFFAGAMSDDPNVRAMVKRRMFAIEDTFGNVYSLITQMENLWSTRIVLTAQHGPAAIVPWRECLRTMRHTALLL